MPRFSKRANLIKDIEAILTDIMAYLRFYQSRRGLLLYQHHLVTGTILEQTLCSWPALGNSWWWDEILFRAVLNCGWLNSIQGQSRRFGFITYEEGCEGAQKPWLLLCILSMPSMFKSSIHSPRLQELPCRHHPQQQIQMFVDVEEECLIAAI